MGYAKTKEDLLEEIGGEENIEKVRVMNPAKLKMSVWLWLHPSAYSIIHWGIPSIAIAQGILLFVLSFYIKYKILYYTGIIFFILGLLTLIKQIKQWKIKKGLTLYDIYIKGGI